LLPDPSEAPSELSGAGCSVSGADCAKAAEVRAIGLKARIETIRAERSESFICWVPFERQFEVRVGIVTVPEAILASG
tara:strand:+ start:137 stop:370 length:234 start_codon:yes stop_codon:yes gene_type:complete